MHEIKLTKGKVALIDDEDVAEVTKYSWCINDKGYARRGPSKSNPYFALHRFILGAKKGEFVDHINQDKLDNRRSNLRICTRAENLRNTPRRHNNRSGYKGVSWHGGKKKWQAEIQVDSVQIYLGAFATAEQAALHYNVAAISYHGDFAHLNVIKCK